MGDRAGYGGGGEAPLAAGRSALGAAKIRRQPLSQPGVEQSQFFVLPARGIQRAELDIRQPQIIAHPGVFSAQAQPLLVGGDCLAMPAQLVVEGAEVVMDSTRAGSLRSAAWCAARARSYCPISPRISPRLRQALA